MKEVDIKEKVEGREELGGVEKNGRARRGVSRRRIQHSRRKRRR